MESKTAQEEEMMNLYNAWKWSYFAEKSFHSNFSL